MSCTETRIDSRLSSHSNDISVLEGRRRSTVLLSQRRKVVLHDDERNRTTRNRSRNSTRRQHVLQSMILPRHLS